MRQQARAGRAHSTRSAAACARDYRSLAPQVPAPLLLRLRNYPVPMFGGLLGARVYLEVVSENRRRKPIEDDIALLMYQLLFCLIGFIIIFCALQYLCASLDASIKY